jgi:hypothetical protein
MTAFTQLMASRYREAVRERRKPVKPSFKGMAWLYPLGGESDYGNWLMAYFNKLMPSMKDAIKKNLRFIFPPQAKKDSYENDWPNLSAELYSQQQQAAELGMEATVATLIYFGNEISDFNLSQWKKFSEVAVGQLFQGDEPWAQAILEEWRTTQLTLIKKLGEDQIAMVGRIIENAVQNGFRAEDAMDEILLKIPHMTEYRAWLIARDQITKLNSAFTKSRQIDAGILFYDWSTALDEKVRGKPGGKYPRAKPSHWAMQGVICPWDDPTKMMRDGVLVDRDENMPKVHPGQEIACRCAAIPNIDDIWRALESVPVK